MALNTPLNMYALCQESKYELCYCIVIIDIISAKHCLATVGLLQIIQGHSEVIIRGSLNFTPQRTFEKRILLLKRRYYRNYRKSLMYGVIHIFSCVCRYLLVRSPCIS